MGKHQMLVVHFLMKEYGGYPSGWLKEDWALCIQLLDINGIIQRVQKRERKKQEFKRKKQGGKKSRKRGRKR